jgi:hypothetical protein
LGLFYHKNRDKNPKYKNLAGETVIVPAGEFNNALQILDQHPLDGDEDEKVWRHVKGSCASFLPPQMRTSASEKEAHYACPKVSSFAHVSVLLVISAGLRRCDRRRFSPVTHYWQ